MRARSAAALRLVLKEREIPVAPAVWKSYTSNVQPEFIVCSGYRRFLWMMEQGTQKLSVHEYEGVLEHSERVAPVLFQSLRNATGLTSFELARGLELVAAETGMQGQELADVLERWSPSHLNNLLRAFRKADARLKQDWKQGLGMREVLQRLQRSPLVKGDPRALQPYLETMPRTAWAAGVLDCLAYLGRRKPSMRADRFLARLEKGTKNADDS